MGPEGSRVSVVGLVGELKEAQASRRPTLAMQGGLEEQRAGSVPVHGRPEGKRAIRNLEADHSVGFCCPTSWSWLSHSVGTPQAVR